jgi:hypothetical protein
VGQFECCLLITQCGYRALHKGAYFKTDEFEFHVRSLMAPVRHNIDAGQGNPAIVDQATRSFTQKESLALN